MVGALILVTADATTIAELAEREGSASSCMTCVLRLTLMAPDIVEAIIDGAQGPEVKLARVSDLFPVDWDGQSDYFVQME